MKKLIAAAFLLSACVAQAEDNLTLEVDNQSDHQITDLSVWEVKDDGTLVDDPLFALVAPVPAHAIPIFPLSIIRCFENVRVLVTYDDGHEASQDLNQCQTQSVAFNYYP